jgi:predicted  nucleic acid-binding Zn-ribbon protein
MHSVLQALQSLQEVDRDLFKVLVELKRLPEEEKRRKAALDKLQARATELRNEAKALRVKSKELDDRATIARQRLKKVDAEAMASRADQALLAAYDHERRTLKRDIGSAEEEGLGLLEQVDALEKQAVEAEAKTAAEQAVHAEFLQNMAKEMSAANARRADLEARRKERIGGGLPADTLALYVRVLSTREGEALAQLDGRTCGACFMEVPTNMVVRVSRGADLVQCPSCDRILYI